MITLEEARLCLDLRVLYTAGAEAEVGHIVRVTDRHVLVRLGRDTVPKAAKPEELEFMPGRQP
jgi:hypothetical protein